MAALIFSALATLLCAEVVVRYLPSQEQYSTPLDLFATCEMPPNSFQYHDYEYPVDKPPHTYRILVVGDSFSACDSVNIDDGYPKRLEHLLNRFGNEDGITYQVLNMSKAGRSTPEEITTAIAHAPRIKADMILVGYCLNDPEDLDDAGYVHTLAKKCTLTHFKKPKGLRRVLYDNSALARMVERRIFNTRAHYGHIEYYHALYRDNYPGWQKSQKSLRDLGDFARADHIRAGVLIFPIFGYGLGDEYPFLDLHAKLHRVIADSGLECLDLLPFYRHRNPICLVIHPVKNTHPNEAAYRIAAEALWCALKGFGAPIPGRGMRLPASVFPKRPPEEETAAAVPAAHC